MRTLSFLADHLIVLSFAIIACEGNIPAETPSVEVTLTASDTGGLVVSEPAGISCGTSCSAAFPVGTPVHLSVIPPQGMKIASWQGACQGAATTCLFTVTEATAVAITYRKIIPTRTLLVTKSGTGTGLVTSDSAGLSCGSSCSLHLLEGSQVLLQISADDASTFTGWSGACTGTALSCPVVLTDDIAVNAAFGKPQSCAQVKDSHPQAVDGAFKLFVGGDAAKPWDAFCQLTAPTATYLPLVNTTTGNFSQYTAGGGRPGNTVRTTFQRLRINPETLRVNVADLTFALSAGLISNPDGSKITRLNYGEAHDCLATNSSAGVGNVDLGGTPFAVAPNSFVTSGYLASGSASYSADARSVNLRGGGFCGGTTVRSGASTPFNLQLLYQP